LQISGKNLAVLFMNVLHRGNPLFLAIRVIAAARTLYDSEVLCISSSGVRSYSSM